MKPGGWYAGVGERACVHARAEGREERGAWIGEREERLREWKGESGRRAFSLFPLSFSLPPPIAVPSSRLGQQRRRGGGPATRGFGASRRASRDTTCWRQRTRSRARACTQARCPKPASQPRFTQPMCAHGRVRAYLSPSSPALALLRWWPYQHGRSVACGSAERPFDVYRGYRRTFEEGRVRGLL